MIVRIEMDIERLNALGEELIRYTTEIGEGKNFVINTLEIQAKIAVLKH